MGDYAFYGTAIYEIDTSNVTSYGQYVFGNTTNLKTFVIKEGVTSIPTNFVRGATGIESIVIPSTVTSMSGYTFVAVHHLKLLL
jgi:hypothetical protein